eukprot:738262-Hanusia_phi.AAC.1
MRGGRGEAGGGAGERIFVNATNQVRERWMKKNRTRVERTFHRTRTGTSREGENEDEGRRR